MKAIYLRIDGRLACPFISDFGCRDTIRESDASKRSEA